MADVKVILGPHAYDLIRLLEYKSGDRNEPWAVQTSLGWTVSGALLKTERNCMAAPCNVPVSSDPLADQMKNGGTCRHTHLFVMFQDDPRKRKNPDNLGRYYKA